VTEDRNFWGLERRALLLTSAPMDVVVRCSSCLSDSCSVKLSFRDRFGLILLYVDLIVFGNSVRKGDHIAQLPLLALTPQAVGAAPLLILGCCLPHSKMYILRAFHLAP